MNVFSIKEFCAKKGFVQVAPVVRTNTNNYPFITFIDADNKSENIYFSKEGAKLVTAGLAVNKGLMSNFQIAELLNEAGEVRIKLISNSARVNLTDLF